MAHKLKHVCRALIEIHTNRGLFVVVHENGEGGGVRCDGEISYK